jgi:CBS domain containing-hemolysin-like protein
MWDMVELTTWLRLVGGFLLLFSNGFFVATEFAITRVRQFPEDEFVGQGRGLERAWEMTERLEIFLTGCQLGITISSVTLGVVAEPALAAVLDPIIRGTGLTDLYGGTEGGHTALSVILSLVIINVFHVSLGEQAPTYLGIERTKTIARYLAPILYWWTRLLSPVIRFADWVAKNLLGLFGVTITRSWADEEAEGEEGEEGVSSRGELRSQMGDLLSGQLPEERTEEVINALEIGEMDVREVMVDREAIVALSIDNDIEANLKLVQERPHTRFPLIDGKLEEFVGTVYTPSLVREIDDLRNGDLDLREIAAEPMTVPADIAVSEAIDQFQEENQELAFVCDDGVVGLVTATDAFEAITGDLEDPFDQHMPGAESD